MLGSQLPDTSMGSPDITTPLVPYSPGVESLESSTPLEVLNEVLNHQTPISSNLIHYKNMNQNTVTGVPNFTNHAHCVE